MAKVKLALQNKSVPDKLADGQTVISQSTGNSLLPLPQPKLTDLTTKRTALLEAMGAANQSDQQAFAAHREQDTAEAEFDAAYGAFGDVVQVASGGVAANIASTGYAVADESHAPIVLTAPQSFGAAAGDEAGEVHVNFDPVRGARNYETQATTDLTGATGWGHSTFSSKSNADVQGLASGTVYALRVRALGTQTGPWSIVIQQRAP